MSRCLQCDQYRETRGGVCEDCRDKNASRAWSALSSRPQVTAPPPSVGGSAAEGGTTEHKPTPPPSPVSAELLGSRAVPGALVKGVRLEAQQATAGSHLLVIVEYADGSEQEVIREYTDGTTPVSHWARVPQDEKHHPITKRAGDA